MDMENELEEFKKHHKPALVGASLRDLEEESKSPSRSSSKPVVKNRESRSQCATLADLKAEGSLVDDGEGELDSIMDGSGHIKSEVLLDDAKSKTEKTPSFSHSLNIDDYKTKDSDESEMNVYGGHGDEFVVPASGKTSGYSHETKKKKKKVVKGSSKDQDEDHDIISAAKVKSVDDIIEEVNTGEFDEKKKRDASLLDSKLSKMMNDLKELNFDAIDDSEAHPDDDMLPPAARRKGSRSQSRASSIAPTESRGRSLARENSGIFQPHLARGDSYHSGLNDENFHHPISSTPSFVNLERQPRHDPNHGQKYFSSSSLNYLRSISRSRSRAANDRKALGENVSLEELKNSGALTNDSEDPSSNGPNFEDAIEKALKHVDSAHHIKSVRSSDVLSNLEDVKEEEDNASCRAMNNDTLLDQLANSAKELMSNPGPENKTSESQLEGDLKGKDTETQGKCVRAEYISTPESEKMEGAIAVDSVKEKQHSSSQKDDRDTDLAHTKNGDKEDFVKVVKDEEASDSFKTSKIVDNNNVKDEKEKVHDESENNEDDVDDEPHEEPLRLPSFSEKCKDSNAEVAERPKDLGASNASLARDENEVEKNSSQSLTVGSQEEADEIQVHGQKPEESVTEDDIEALIAEAMKEQSSKGRSYDKTDELAVLVAGAVKEQKDIRDYADFDALIAAVRKEKESKSTSKNESQGDNDGSLYVPKASKMEFEDEPVYLYTSLAGGFHIHNRTQRVITILTVNKIAYTVRDLGTDEEAKSIWRRYCGGKTLPGIVRGKDDFIGNWEDIEEANENYAVRSLIYETY